MRDVCAPPDQTIAGMHWLQRIILDERPVAARWWGGRWTITQRNQVECMSPRDAFSFGYRYSRAALTPEQEDALHAELDGLTATVAEHTGFNETLRRHNEKLIAEGDRLLATNSALNDMVQRQREIIEAVEENLQRHWGMVAELRATVCRLQDERERLRAALTDATTALDDAAGDAADLEWRVM